MSLHVMSSLVSDLMESLQSQAELHLETMRNWKYYHVYCQIRAGVPWPELSTTRGVPEYRSSTSISDRLSLFETKQAIPHALLKRRYVIPRYENDAVYLTARSLFKDVGINAIPKKMHGQYTVDLTDQQAKALYQRLGENRPVDITDALPKVERFLNDIELYRKDKRFEATFKALDRLHSNLIKKDIC